MRIIINELRKIFNFRSTIVLILGSLLIYKFLPSFYIENFPNGRPDTDIYRLTTMMVEKYGTTMDHEELKDLKVIHENKIKEADEYFKNNKEFNSFDIYSYEDFKTVEEYYFDNNGDDKEKEFTDLKWNLLWAEEGDIIWELQVLPYIIGNYEGKEEIETLTSYFGLEKRINEMIEDKEVDSILSYGVINNYNELMKGFIVMIIIGIVYMIAPIYLQDKANKLEYIQYSSKIGRGLFKKKLVAALLAGGIIATVNFIIMMILYRGNNTSMFFNSNINSFLNYMKSWFSITFIQYIILTVVLTYVIALITTLSTVFLSSKVSSFVEGVGAAIPLGFILAILAYNVLINKVGNILMPKYFIVILYIILIIASVVLIVGACKKERKRSI